MWSHYPDVWSEKAFVCGLCLGILPSSLEKACKVDTLNIHLNARGKPSRIAQLAAEDEDAQCGLSLNFNTTLIIHKTILCRVEQEVALTKQSLLPALAAHIVVPRCGSHCNLSRTNDIMLLIGRGVMLVQLRSLLRYYPIDPYIFSILSVLLPHIKKYHITALSRPPPTCLSVSYDLIMGGLCNITSFNVQCIIYDTEKWGFV